MANFFSKLLPSLFLSIAAQIVLLSSPIHAQFRIGPMVIQEETNRGQARGLMKITNITNKKVRARLFSAPFTYNSEGFKLLQDSANDLSSYLIFSPRELEIEAGETRQVRLNVRMLPSTEQGEYRAVIFTEDLNANESGGINFSETQIKPLIGVAFYVNHGESNSNLLVEDVIYDSESQLIQFKLSNSGNKTVRPEVRWEIKQGNKVITLTKYSKFTVIAEGTRRISFPLLSEDIQLSSGNYQIVGDFIWRDQETEQRLPFDLELTLD